MRRVLIAVGGAIMAYAVVGALTDADAHPVGHLVFLAAVLVTHDGVLLPLAIGVGVLIGRYVPSSVRVAVRAAAFTTATLLVVAVPLALGFGRRADDPSALPSNYGRGLVVLLALIWSAVLAHRVATAVRRRRTAARTGSTGPAVDTDGSADR
jgi:hypothetical protein